MSPTLSRAVFGSLLFGATAATSVQAAPLDALLDATPRASKWEVEAAYDLANRKVDLFHIRPPTKASAGVVPGDYEGGHLRVQWAPLPRLDVEGSYWQRKIDYRSFTANIQTWQLAGQWRAMDAQGWRPNLGVRFGAWGNASDELRRMTSVTVEGVKFTSARVTEPRDLQYQLDVIATWPLTKTLSGTVFLGAVASQTDFDQVDATSEQGGCTYNVQFTETNVIAICDSDGRYIRAVVPNAVYGIDVATEARYKSTMLNAGAGLRWQRDRWHTALGYKLTTIQRDRVDQVVVERGGTPYRRNHILMLDVSYQATEHWTPFIRGQLMSNQFNGEAPMSYNTLTANRFGRRYGLLTLGVKGNY